MAFKGYDRIEHILISYGVPPDHVREARNELIDVLLDIFNEKFAPLGTRKIGSPSEKLLDKIPK